MSAEQQEGMISFNDALNAIRSVIIETAKEIPDRDARNSHQHYLQRALRNIYKLDRNGQ